MRSPRLTPGPSIAMSWRHGQSLRLEGFPEGTALLSCALPRVLPFLKLNRDEDGTHYTAELLRGPPKRPFRPKLINMTPSMCVPTETIEGVLGQDPPAHLGDLSQVSTLVWSRGSGLLRFTKVPLPGKGDSAAVLKYDSNLGKFTHSAIICTAEGSLGPETANFVAPIRALWTMDPSKLRDDVIRRFCNGEELVLQPQDLVFHPLFRIGPMANMAGCQ